NLCPAAQRQTAGPPPEPRPPRHPVPAQSHAGALHTVPTSGTGYGDPRLGVPLVVLQPAAPCLKHLTPFFAGRPAPALVCYAAHFAPTGQRPRSRGPGDASHSRPPS